VARELALSPPYSIARRLTDAWLAADPARQPDLGFSHTCSFPLQT